MSGPGHSGEAFGVDLYHLWGAGKEALPTVAAVYATACNGLAGTYSSVDSAFQGVEPFSGYSVKASWTALRDALQDALAEAATSLELTGESLCIAAENYAGSDAGARNEFRRLLSVNGEPKNVSVPDPIRPADQRPPAPNGVPDAVSKSGGQAQ
jgi:hypothetical protein